MAKKGEFKKGATDKTKKNRKNDGSKKRKLARAARTRARRKAVKEGRVRKGDGKVVNHKTPLSKGGSKSKSAKTTITSRKDSDIEGGKLRGKNKKTRSDKGKKRGKKK